MDPGDIHFLSKDLAARLIEALLATRLQRVDIDVVRAATIGLVVAWNAKGGRATVAQVAQLEEATLRKCVEGVG